MENGIALYSIELHGCLNGLYTNDGSHGEISNEIAKLRPGTEAGADGISGEYDCFYFDEKNRREGHTLIIIAHNTHSDNPEIVWYEFIWVNKKEKEEFRGTGYKMNSGQIAVHYKYVQEENLVPRA